jgi:PAS domain-containing protein
VERPVQHEVEIILIRRWGSYVALPLFLIGADGRLLYYNEAAGELLGRHYDESAMMSADDLAELFATATRDGELLPADGLPIVQALRTRRPAHGALRFVALDGVSRDIDVTALPLMGQAGRFLGVLTAFWERTDP